ncbi:MAG: hypothetical protein KHW95_09535, partial [Firmicutes bacterium]|nr:hypothetical protein [Bacillota bacterium]
FSGEEAEKDFCGRLFFLAAIFPFSNEKACLGVIAKTDFFYRLTAPHCCSAMQLLLFCCSEPGKKRCVALVLRETLRFPPQPRHRAPAITVSVAASIRL